MLAAYAYGADGCDRRDDDYACIYDNLSNFEEEQFIDDERRAEFMEQYQGVIAYSDLPHNSQLLYILCGGAWELAPVKGPNDIIKELVSTPWTDLDVICESEV